MANLKKIREGYKEEEAEKIAASNKIYDDQYAATEKIYNQQIEDSNASYAKMYDRANVQRIVNERYAKEMAANMGLSNSGYNRTQQTQIMLAYGNAVLETDYQKTAAANSIRSQLASLKADIEAKKASSALSIQDSYDQLARTTYNQQVAAEQAAEKARVEAQNNAIANLRSISEKCSTFEDNNKLAAYLDGLVLTGVISSEEADNLYANYVYDVPTSNNESSEPLPLNERTWTMTDDGGGNGFGGIDRNGKAKDQYGKEYSMIDLYRELKKIMPDKDARDYVKNLQKSIGITKK